MLIGSNTIIIKIGIGALDIIAAPIFAWLSFDKFLIVRIIAPPLIFAHKETRCSYRTSIATLP